MKLEGSIKLETDVGCVKWSGDRIPSVQRAPINQSFDQISSKHFETSTPCRRLWWGQSDEQDNGGRGSTLGNFMTTGNKGQRASEFLQGSWCDKWNDRHGQNMDTVSINYVGRDMYKK